MARIEKQKKQAAQLNLWLNKNYKTAAGALFAVVLLAGGFWLVYPKYQGLRQVTTRSLPDKIGELQALENYAAKIKELETAINNWQTKNNAQVKILEQVLPAAPKVPELIAQLDALARTSGFTINSVDFSESEAGLEPAAGSTGRANPKAGKKADAAVNLNLDKNIHLVNINLNLTGGDYSAFKKFLDAVEKNMRLLDVASIDFSSSLNQSADYNLALTTYYLISPTGEN